ncbi:T9SS type A sorting domain-containing protein [Taibaiella koreensis]|uniref:T9SS type A sorting domain-containing protein n=1 Tax=Taibaiella koreensis TaxID=1268548 RepID=UPI000E59A7B6|nr:T9SS type A sorting domain-containing protein [Taibaiella koreensis]
MKKILLFLTLLCPVLLYAQQQPGDIDTPYAYVNNFVDSGSVHKLLRQPDGKLLLCGDFTSYDGRPRAMLARTDGQGNLDMNFYSTANGFYYNNAEGLTASLHTMALLPGGKLLVGGRFNFYGSRLVLSIARLHTDGSLDTSFNANGVAFLKGNSAGTVYSILVQPDGKILVGGDFDKYNMLPARGLVRLNADGTADATFNAGGTGFGYGSGSGTIETLVMQDNGKIIVGGNFTSYNGMAKKMLLRLNTDGTQDPTFNQAGTGFSAMAGNVTVHVLATDNLGHLHIGGNFINYNNAYWQSYLKLDTAGNLLNGTNEFFYSEVYDIKPDGNKVYCAGNFLYTAHGDNAYGLIRLDSAGVADTTLNIRTGFQYDVTATGIVKTLMLQGDSMVLAAGRFKKLHQENRLMAIARLRTNGSTDTTAFIRQAAFSEEVLAMATQQDQKVVAVGPSYFYNNYASPRIVRLNTDGKRDTSFHVGAGFNSKASCIAIQSDGKIIVGGGFTAYHDTTRSALVRLNPDGNLDNSFNIGSGFYANSFDDFHSEIYALALLPNGQILVGGDFKAYNGTPVRSMVRLNADGSMDNSFFNGFDINNAIITTIAVQNDGKILAGGSFMTYNGQQAEGIIRLNADGTADPAFNQSGVAFQYYTPPGTNITYGSSVSVIKVQTDGKILVGGSFLAYNNSLVNDLVRLNANGSRDMTFNNSGSGFFMMPETLFWYNWGYVSDLYIQPDDKIIAVGQFQKYNGTAAQNIIRLHTDGSMDPIFTPEAGNNSSYEYNDDYSPYTVRKIVALPNNQVVIGGRFPDCNKVVKGGIARLNNAADFVPLSLTVSTLNNVPAVINQPAGTLQLQAELLPFLSNQAVTWSTGNGAGIATVDNSGLVTAASNGIVWVKAVSVANSNLSDSIQVLITDQGTGITALQENIFLQVYPNPTTSKVQVWCNGHFSNGSLTLTDVNGVHVLQQKITVDRNRFELDLNQIRAGVYILDLETGRGHHRTKIVKQ